MNKKEKSKIETKIKFYQYTIKNNKYENNYYLSKFNDRIRLLKWVLNMDKTYFKKKDLKI